MLQNVEFYQATIDELPLEDESVDCVISNCVINLASDKPAVFREIARVLKPGGRLAVSDIALKKNLPEEIEKDVMAYVGCIAGAIPIEDYKSGLTDAGFAHVQVIDSKADLNAYSKVEGQGGCCSPPMTNPNGLNVLSDPCCGTGATQNSQIHSELSELLARHDINEYAASVKVYAVKPG